MEQITVRYEGIGWCQGKIQRQMKDTRRRKTNSEEEQLTNGDARTSMARVISRTYDDRKAVHGLAVSARLFFPYQLNGTEKCYEYVPADEYGRDHL